MGAIIGLTVLVVLLFAAGVWALCVAASHEPPEPRGKS
jgi:hypothetical protein